MTEHCSCGCGAQPLKLMEVLMAASPAERARAYRARKGQGTVPGRPRTAACGTRSAYQRHLRNGEEPCAACRVANATYHRERSGAPE